MAIVSLDQDISNVHTKFQIICMNQFFVERIGWALETEGQEGATQCRQWLPSRLHPHARRGGWVGANC